MVSFQKLVSLPHNYHVLVVAVSLSLGILLAIDFKIIYVI